MIGAAKQALGRLVGWETSAALLKLARVLEVVMVSVVGQVVLSCLKAYGVVPG